MFTSEDQSHPCRALVAEFLKKPTSTIGRKLAERLRDETSNTSGLGLFFVMIGANEGAILALLCQGSLPIRESLRKGKAIL